jgi:uncharacterized RDD family membrane protein YckC
MTAADASQAEGLEPAYARFWPRVRALFLDSIILLLVMVAGLVIATSIKANGAARVVGFAVAGFWLLYEPIMVAFWGGTIGHLRTNLRVVDDRTHGNVSFLKAVARAVIKAVLGLPSFVTMLVTRRSQAVHDLLTGSTVQVRDLSRAAPSLYVHERTELAGSTMPSAKRRAVFILGYVLGVTVLCCLLVGVLSEVRIISAACVDNDECTPRDDLILYSVIVGWLVAFLVVLVLGWRGRLYGCRLRGA